MNASLRSLRAGLIILRSLQVALAIAVIIANALIISMLSKDVNFLKDTARLPRADKRLFVTGYGTTESSTDDPLNSQVSGLMAGSIINLAVAIITLSLTLSWLIYTISAKARARGSAGLDRRMYTRYTCDIYWDAVMAVIYFTMFIVSLAICVVDVSVSRIFTNLSVFQILYTAIFTILFIVSAALAGEMRHHAFAAEHDRALADAKLIHSPIITQRISFIDRLEPGAVVASPPEAAHDNSEHEFVAGPANGPSATPPV